MNAVKIALVAALSLFLTTAVFSVSEEKSAMASVTVNEFVSITLTDYGTAGINFSSLDPDTTDNPETDQNSTQGSVNVANDAVSNVDVNLHVKGADFCTDFPTCAGDTLTVGNASWHTSDAAGSSTALTTAYVDTVVDLAPSASQDLWHWLDIPSGQAAGSYSSTFSFKGDTT